MKSLKLLLITPLLLVAQETNVMHPLINDFFHYVPVEKYQDFGKYVNTPLQAEALAYITDSTKQYNATRDGKMQKMPYWTQSARVFYKSYKEENNLVSANAGAFIIKAYVGTHVKEFQPMFREMSKALSDAKICPAMIDYAKILKAEHNIAEARKIAMDAATICDGVLRMDKVTKASINQILGGNNANCSIFTL